MGSPRHFLDSGAFSLWTKALVHYKSGGTRWGYYDSDEFMEYMDNYISFVKEHAGALDLYANLDVIGNAELTYRNQKFLEKKGLAPVPVVHLGSDPKWLRRYRGEGYDIIGLGGLVGKAVRRGWLDSVFDSICDGPRRTPSVRLHGFGIVNHWALVRYPWYSVDSAAWIKEAGRWGAVFVPHKRGGRFVFQTSPYKILMATTVLKSRHYQKGHGRSGNAHFQSLSVIEKKTVTEWLERIGQRMDGEEGLSSSADARSVANLKFFQELAKSLPEYPWSFRGIVNKGFPV